MGKNARHTLIVNRLPLKPRNRSVCGISFLSIVYSSTATTFGDAADGVVDGVANMLTTCDATGMFFTFDLINIVTADCAAGL